MNLLKQSTAATIKLGPFIDDGDGKSAETGLTISQADIRLSKNGGDIAQTHDATGATHDELGYYNVPLDATDTNTLGRLLVAVHESGALPVWQDFLVVTANVYDTLCSTDTFDVNVTALADDVITAGKFDESTAYPLKSADTGVTQVARVGADGDTLETLSDEIAAVGTNLPTVTQISEAVWHESTLDGMSDGADTMGYDLITATDAIKAKTDNLPADPADDSDIDAQLAAIKAETALIVEDTGTTIPATLANLALEATLTAIKGSGWVTQNNLSHISSTMATDNLLATVDNKLDIVDDLLDTEIAAILADTNELQTDLVNGGRLDLLIDSIIAHLVGIKGAGWTDETLKVIRDALTAAQADLDNPDQYKADVSALATTAHVQEVEDKVDRADAVADAIKAKTDQLTFTVANKVDATATTDTSSVAADVWSHATRTLTNQGVEAIYPAGGDPLTIYRDTTVTISLTGLGDSTGDAGTKIFFTAKENLEDADSNSILQLVCTRANPITDPDTTALLYVNKVAPTLSTEGSFVFEDHTDGTAVITVDGSAAAHLPIYAASPLYWDVKMVTAAGVSTILSTGSMYIYGTPTRTIA